MTGALPASHNHDPALLKARAAMLDVLRRSIRDPRVIEAMAAVPRERFVPPHLGARAYEDAALPIGEGQTISQPFVVAIMLDALSLRSADRALEVGAGSGYASAVLSRLAASVIATERVGALRERASAAVRELRLENVSVVPAGSDLGFAARAPYDAILVSAAAPHVPRTLLDQLAEGGRLVIPIGTRAAQQLVRVVRTRRGLAFDRIGACAFVPLIGDDAWPDPA